MSMFEFYLGYFPDHETQSAYTIRVSVNVYCMGQGIQKWTK